MRKKCECMPIIRQLTQDSANATPGCISRVTPALSAKVCARFIIWLRSCSKQTQFGGCLMKGEGVSTQGKGFYSPFLA